MKTYIQKGYYKEIDLSPLATSLNHFVEVKENKHYLGTTVLTVKDLLGMIDSYLLNINEEEFEHISKSQKRKMVRVLFDILTNE